MIKKKKTISSLSNINPIVVLKIDKPSNNIS